jgi:two-component system, NtrC family, response regulator AtoC
VRDLPAHLRETGGSSALPPGGGTLEELEKQAIARALQASEGNRTRAAEQLGISRRTLHRKIAEYGFEELK